MEPTCQIENWLSILVLKQYPYSSKPMQCPGSCRQCLRSRLNGCGLSPCQSCHYKLLWWNEKCSVCCQLWHSVLVIMLTPVSIWLQPHFYLSQALALIVVPCGFWTHFCMHRGGELCSFTEHLPGSYQLCGWKAGSHTGLNELSVQGWEKQNRLQARSKQKLLAAGGAWNRPTR